MLADTRCELTTALGMELDRVAALGSVRSQRYALVVDDGKIVKIAKDEESFAPNILRFLKE